MKKFKKRSWVFLSPLAELQQCTHAPVEIPRTQRMASNTDFFMSLPTPQHAFKGSSGSFLSQLWALPLQEALKTLPLTLRSCALHLPRRSETAVIDFRRLIFHFYHLFFPDLTSLQCGHSREWKVDEIEKNPGTAPHPLSVHCLSLASAFAF